MKRILLTLLMIGFCIIAWGQYTPAYNVNGYMNVKKSLWVNDTLLCHLVSVDTLTGDVFVDSISTTYLTTVNAKITGLTVSTSDTAVIMSGDSLYYRIFPSGGFDSTHCWSALYTSNLVGCSPIRINSSKISFGNATTDVGSWAVLDSATGNYFISNKGTGVLGALTGTNNIAIGNGAGWYLTGATSSHNVYIGGGAGGNSSDAAIGNVGVGRNALFGCNNYYNTAVGDNAGYGSTTGGYNTHIGAAAGKNITTGQYNINIGYSAGSDYSNPGANLSYGINIGTYAGTYQTQNGRFIVNNYFQGTALKDSVDSYMYGGMSATSSASFLRLNTNLSVKHDLTALSNVLITSLKDTVQQMVAMDTSGTLYTIPLGGTDITCVDGANYDVLKSDLFISDSTDGGNDTINLPNNPIDGEYYEVCKDVNSAAGNTVINADGTYYTITSADDCMGFRYMACRSRWQKFDY